MSKVTKTVGDLRAAPYNPRTITDPKLAALAKAMERFGDLSGVVFNRRTGQLVGGHQRVKNLPADAPITITDRLEKANEQGTVALGHIEVAGERWVYREVDWDEQTEGAANVAANKHGGEWDMPLLSELLASLDGGGFDMELTGFDDKELAKLLESDPALRDENVGPSLGDVEYQIVVSCAEEHQQAELCAELEAKGFKCRLLTL